MSNKVVYINISKLYSLEGGVRVQQALNEVGIYEDAYLKVADGIICEIGYMKDLKITDETVVDVKNQIMIPGLIDAHSHLVFGGNRVNEYAMKIQGASYLEIYQAGGGIHSTVKATRDASFTELYKKAEKAIQEFMSCGVTTLEAKSGYGLNYETELKQLRVVKELQKNVPIELVSTFMPAHALEQGKEAYAYLGEMIKEVLPVVVKEDLAEYMDCFLEKGIFDAEQSMYILQAGKEAGLKIKIHIDEMEDIGGTEVACALGATSVEHCMVTNAKSMDQLKENGIVTVILPATSFNLGKPYANVPLMKEKGLMIALSNDYNPGSCPCTDSLWMARIASRGCHLTPNEVLSMMTINAAKAIDREDRIGSLEVGKQADFVIMNVDSFDEVIAHMMANPITAVYKKGIRIV
ncbi:MAG: imidazolonepropionase [Erysipelotrichaceae bacterium]|nr:imidazolonepropionase [Erysipelotrichaceae bacterium]